MKRQSRLGEKSRLQATRIRRTRKRSRRRVTAAKIIKSEKAYNEALNVILGQWRETLLTAIAPELAAIKQADKPLLTRVSDADQVYMVRKKRDAVSSTLVSILYAKIRSAASSFRDNLFKDNRQRFGEIFSNAAADLNEELQDVQPDDIAIFSPRYGQAIKSSLDASEQIVNNFGEEAGNRAILKIDSLLSKGARWEEIAIAIEGDISKDNDFYRDEFNRAKFIARNEVGNALGAINQVSQEDAGIRFYTWETAGDERVRHTHGDLDGKVFTWSGAAITAEDANGTVKTIEGAIDPNFSGSPTTPGKPWNCRCVAIAFDEDIDDWPA